jgi:hypothetical protein
MPDITMCANTHCKYNHECYRYTATPSFRQSFYMHDVRNDDGTCDQFWPITSRERRADAILAARTEQPSKEDR